MSDVTRTVHSLLVYAALHVCKAAPAGRMHIRRVTSIMSKTMRYLLCISVLGLVALSTMPITQRATAQYVHPDEALFVGTPILLSLPHPGDTLHVTYRPGSRISSSEALPSLNQYRTWVPREAGVVSLATTRGDVQNVSVRYRNFPREGALVLLFAGTVFFGGALLAFWSLFS